MNPHLIDPRTDSDLRRLDAAAPLTAADRQHADALLASIVATDPAEGADPVVVPIRRAGRGTRTTRWLAAAASVGLVATGVGALSSINAPEAFATWTASPAEVAAKDFAAFEKACRAKVDGGGGPTAWLDAGRLSVRLAERRGDYVAMLLTGPGRDAQATPEASASCVGAMKPGSGEVGDLSAGASGGGGLPAPTGQQFTEGGISQFQMGGGPFGGGEPASFVDGRIGPEVAKLTIHAGKASVEASIKDGTYAAWWPGRAFADEPLPPSGEGGPAPILTYDLTLTDGTVLKDVRPSRL